MVQCPVCQKEVDEQNINQHLDSGCTSHIVDIDAKPESNRNSPAPTAPPPSTTKPLFFKTPVSKSANRSFENGFSATQPSPSIISPNTDAASATSEQNGTKRSFEAADLDDTPRAANGDSAPANKKSKMSSIMQKVAPLAERMRPRSLDDVHGQDLVGPDGVLRGLVEQNKLPSMILWGGPGTGKTTIARLIAFKTGCRFVEINSTSSGVGDCKKIFAEARNELQLTGRKTIVFTDEIHRYSKAQQDVFLGPVEAGQITLIGATTENPSFKVVNALLSRCRTFTLAKLTDENLVEIMERAIKSECGDEDGPALLDADFLTFLAAFSDGDARTALNLLELALDLATRPDMSIEKLKQSLTKTLVYDRNGDQHYDNISAFHKSIRGSDPDAALYYLARMLQSGEDPLYIARRMIVIASEDVGLADNTLLPLATAAYTAAEKVGLPEARINLAHCAVALALSPKSTRSYRGLQNAMKALSEPGIAGLPVPLHMRNAPTKLMKELGYGKEYKYNPDYADGKVAQVYLPDKLVDRRFLEDRDLGEKEDPELETTEYFDQPEYRSSQ